MVTIQDWKHFVRNYKSDLRCDRSIGGIRFTKRNAYYVFRWSDGGTCFVFLTFNQDCRMVDDIYRDCKQFDHLPISRHPLQRV